MNSLKDLQLDFSQISFVHWYFIFMASSETFIKRGSPRSHYSPTGKADRESQQAGPPQLPDPFHRALRRSTPRGSHFVTRLYVAHSPDDPAGGRVPTLHARAQLGHSQASCPCRIGRPSTSATPHGLQPCTGHIAPLPQLCGVCGPFTT